jgi:hypothetical protein
MKSLLNHIVYTILVMAPIVLHSCKDKDPDTDPCENYRRPIADFLVQDDLQQQCSNELGFTLSCDTIVKNGQYTFKSALDYDTYLWEVIGNPSFKRTTKSFPLTFPSVNKIQMRLVGKRKPNNTCDPNDDGIDTIIKTISVTDTTIIYGKFVGYDSANPNEEVGMEIVYEKRPGYVNYYTYINYFPDSCNDSKFGLGISFTYNLIFLNYHNTQGGGTLSCQSPRGWCIFTPTGVNIQYATKDILTPGSIPIKRRFIGRRI